ncbi:MazG-like family protein [Streptomyces cellostaticus]|uniref:MazG-like family protein n=1 Tax=Streptomyces TaxID=1883 RepID=UPI002027240F|nr:MazG-like family protein [Streptomyces cellostaticus]
MTSENMAGTSGTTEPDPGLWPAVDELWARLEALREHSGPEGVLLRILKLSEEVGEVAEAVIGATGQNPRKGVTHTWDDVQSELCDVAITALVALRTLTPEAQGVFERHLERVRERPPAPPA